MWYQSHLKVRDGDTNRFTPRAKVKQLEIPSFLGRIDAEAYLEWEEEIELVFSFHQFTEEMKVRLAATGFSGLASNWWWQIETTRRRQGKPQISSWVEMKTMMMKRFVPPHYFRDLCQKTRSLSHRSKILKEAPQMEQPKRRRHPTQGPLETPSKPHTIKDEKSGVKPKEGPQTVACIIGDQKKSPITPMMAKNVESFRMQDGETRLKREEPPNGSKGDICPRKQAYQPNQEELSHESTDSRNLTHEGITEKKNWIKSFPHEKDIQLSIRHTSSEPEGDQRLLIETFRPNRDEPSYKPTCFRNLIHHRYQTNWIHFKIHYGLEVIQFQNQEILGGPNLEAHGFNRLQNQLWRPGEVNKRPEKSFIFLEGLDLRTNPFKGGGDGVILAGPKLINGPSREVEEQHSPLGRKEECLDVCYGPLEIIHKRDVTWAQKKDVTKAHMFKTAQVKEASGLWQSPVKRPPELKFIKRPFHVWCWTCTRKRRGPSQGPIRFKV